MPGGRRFRKALDRRAHGDVRAGPPRDRCAGRRVEEVKAAGLRRKDENFLQREEGIHRGHERLSLEETVHEALGAEFLHMADAEREAAVGRTQRLGAHAERDGPGGERGAPPRSAPPTRRRPPSIRPESKFIGGEPMKVATKVVAGRR